MSECVRTCAHTCMSECSVGLRHATLIVVKLWMVT